MKNNLFFVQNVALKKVGQHKKKNKQLSIANAVKLPSGILYVLGDNHSHRILHQTEMHLSTCQLSTMALNHLLKYALLFEMCCPSQ